MYMYMYMHEHVYVLYMYTCMYMYMYGGNAGIFVACTSYFVYKMRKLKI